MKIIIGISRAGSSYLAKKIHEKINPMWVEKNDHNEDLHINTALRTYLNKYGPNGLFFNRPVHNYFNNILIKNSLECHKKKYPNHGFKEPRLIHVINLLKQVYPKAELIALTRNYYDWRESHRRRNREGDYWDKILNAHYIHMMKIITRYKDGLTIIDYKDIPKIKGIDTSDFKLKTYG
jgi:hypothetical protein